MTFREKILRLIVVFVSLLVSLGALYIACEKALSLPFRGTNDVLHKQESPVTLDFLIPAGIHIDEKMTIGQVAALRLEKRGNRLNAFVVKISECIPARYRLLGTVTVYLCWTFLFLVFFRLFTWMRYVTALATSFLCGAVVYFYMPDLMIGRLDDIGFLMWAGAFLVTLRWHSKRKRLDAP
jgi:hypothetical protein